MNRRTRLPKRRKPPTFIQSVLTILAGIGLGWWSGLNANRHYGLAVLGVNASIVVVLVGVLYAMLAVVRRLVPPAN